MISKSNFVKACLSLWLAGTLNLSAADKSASPALPVREFCIAAPSSNRVDVWSETGGFLDQYYGRKPANDSKNPGHKESKCFVRMFEEVAHHQ